MYDIIVHLAAAIVLLLWAVRMVRTAVERAYSAQLKRMLNHANGNLIAAAGAGTMMAAALQSSTAVAMLATGFASGGLMSGPTGLALMLGAYLGSALVASVLTFDLGGLTPLLIISGGLLFLKGHARQTKQMGRLIMGIAFLLLSLEMVSDATAVWRDAGHLEAVIGYLSGDLWTAFIVSALITWASHSSVATILVIATFGAQGLVPLDVGVAFMLGANLGGTMIPIGLTRASDVRAKRIAFGSLFFRGGAAVLALVAFQFLHSDGANLLPGTIGQQIVASHIGFNAIVLILGLPLTPLVAKLCDRLLTAQPVETEFDIARLRSPALSPDNSQNIDLALASATRELLRMSETVEVMLQPIMEIFESGDKVAIRQIKLLENEVDRANRDIKLFLTRLNWDQMDAEQTRRAAELTSFAINLEQAGDIIANLLVKLAEQKVNKKLSFSEQGWQELTDLHARVLANMQLALNVLVSSDPDSARELVIEKDDIGSFERESMARHFQRLRSGAITSIETSDLHLETIHALKRINSLFSGIAYSILSESGDLLETRLARTDM